MSHLKTKTVELVDTWCGVCGIDFAMPDWLYKKRREDGQSFWCPRGCQIGFTEPEVTRLRKQVERLKSREIHLEDQRLAAQRSAAAYKGKVTQLSKRIANGVCPCCNRSFVNVARHMQSQHPDFAPSDLEQST